MYIDILCNNATVLQVENANGVVGYHSMYRILRTKYDMLIGRYEIYFFNNAPVYEMYLLLTSYNIVQNGFVDKLVI